MDYPMPLATELDRSILLSRKPGAGDEDLGSIVVQQQPSSNPTPVPKSPRARTVADHKENMRWIFFFLSLISVALDPLFLYIPIIDDTKKCLGMDKSLRNAALILRSLADIPFLVRIIDQVRNKINAESCPKLDNFVTSIFVVEFLAILPVPQVAVVLIFFQLKGSWYLYNRSLMNAFIVFQYCPRIGRICLTRKEIKISNIWIRSAFNIFLYILASHVLGAFWYFLSLQRGISCWHQACGNTARCKTTNYCDDTWTSTNLTFLYESCPINQPDPTVFDFGIFLDALQSGTTGPINFSTKLVYTLWWGFRNMSNFGTNLQTSTYLWENCFALLTSVIGLLLFLLLIGNVQTYMHLASQNYWEKSLRQKEREIRRWMLRNCLPEYMNRQIMQNIKKTLQENRDKDLDADASCLFSFLSPDIATSVKQHICINALKKVPMLQHMDYRVMELMCESLKPVSYPEHSYIVQEGEELGLILIVTEGIIWTWTPTTCSAGKANSSFVIKGLQTGDFFGEKLLVWSSTNNTFSGLPTSTQVVKCQTNVHAFTLSADDLRSVVSKCGSLWNFGNGNISAHDRRRQVFPASLGYDDI